MSTITHDRTYWRACGNKRLVEEARDSGNELAIALGERLADCGDIDDFKALEREIDALERQAEDDALRIEDLTDDNAMLYKEVTTAEAILRRFSLLASAHSEHVGHIFGDVASQAGAWVEQFEQGGRDDV